MSLSIQNKKNNSWIWNTFIIIMTIGLGILLVNYFIISPLQKNTPNTLLPNIPSITPTPIYASKEVYQKWVNEYVKIESDNARVITHENGETVSEGIAYGMLLAAHMEDWKLFDSFQNYASSHLTADGFMNWKIDSDGNISAKGEATDAEIDRANALLIAHSKTNKEGYLQAAKELIIKIEIHLINYEGKFLEPWKDSGASVINLSYYDPYVFQKFYNITGNIIWNDLSNSYYQLIENIKANEGTKDTGLLPDWSTAEGKVSVGGNGPRSFDSSYDASRIYWRLMIAALNNDEKAQAHLKLIREYGNSINITNTYEFWAIRSLDGTPNYKREQNTIGAIPFAAAFLASSSTTDQQWALTALQHTWADNYFNSTMRALLITSYENKE